MRALLVTLAVLLPAACAAPPALPDAAVLPFPYRYTPETDLEPSGWKRP